MLLDIFRITSQLLEIDGWEKLILLRYGHFCIFSEALIVCGAFSFCAYRYQFQLPCTLFVKLFVYVLKFMKWCLKLASFYKAMIIVAWNGTGELSSIFSSDVFKKVLSVFITAAILKLGQGR
jgi:hypothetical protein